MRERQAYVARHPFPTRGDKAVRAQSIRGRMVLDGLHFPRSAPWRQSFEAELLTFPAGRHDDQVDALGLVGQLLDRMIKGSALKPKSDEREDRYAKLFANDDEEGATSWKTVWRPTIPRTSHDQQRPSCRDSLFQMTASRLLKLTGMTWRACVSPIASLSITMSH